MMETFTTGTFHFYSHLTVQFFFSRPQEIDEAARRRFVKRLYIPLPEGEARKQIVLNLLSQQTFQLTEGELQTIQLKSEGKPPVMTYGKQKFIIPIEIQICGKFLMLTLHIFVECFQATLVPICHTYVRKQPLAQ